MWRLQNACSSGLWPQYLFSELHFEVVYFHSRNVRWNHNIYYSTLVQCQCNILLGNTPQWKRRSVTFHSAYHLRRAGAEWGPKHTNPVLSYIVVPEPKSLVWRLISSFETIQVLMVLMKEAEFDGSGIFFVFTQMASSHRYCLCRLLHVETQVLGVAS